MTGPTTATIKRLFSLSRNVCAFPKCSNTLVDENSGKVTGRICHIKARSEGGPRFDATQTNEERHGFDNLVLMCPSHHDVIDADEESYTVERLMKIKSDHASISGIQKEISEKTAQEFINNIDSNTVTNGSIIINQNQMGGQVAHTITNYGPQPRQISQAAADALINELKKYPSENFRIICIMNNAESHRLALIVEDILKKAGWRSTDGLIQMMFTIPMQNVKIEIPHRTTTFDILVNWFLQIGLKPTCGLCGEAIKTNDIIIGENT